jgi:hypothetical protein
MEAGVSRPGGSPDLQNCIAGNRIQILTNIYTDSINMAVWNRRVNGGIQAYVKWLKTQSKMSTLCMYVELEHMSRELAQHLPEHADKSAFLEDVVFITEMYCCLFGVSAVGLRLVMLDRAMCPKFHVDRVTCRLITTYGGPGTEWLPDKFVDRSELGVKTIPDNEFNLYDDVNSIQRLMEYDVALFKGEAWEGNEGRGIVHRSPPINEADPRLLLTLDML